MFYHRIADKLAKSDTTAVESPTVFNTEATLSTTSTTPKVTGTETATSAISTTSEISDTILDDDNDDCRYTTVTDIPRHYGPARVFATHSEFLSVDTVCSILNASHPQQVMSRGPPIKPDGNVKFLYVAGSVKDIHDLFGSSTTEGGYTSTVRRTAKSTSGATLHYKEEREKSTLANCIVWKRYTQTECRGICLECRNMPPSSTMDRKVSWLSNTLTRSEKGKKLKIGDATGLILVEFKGNREFIHGVRHGNSRTKTEPFVATLPSVRVEAANRHAKGEAPEIVRQRMQAASGGCRSEVVPD